MSLSFRRINIAGRFPFVRLIQIWDNPAYLLHILKKNLIYKRECTDYREKYSAFRFLSGQETLEELIRTGKSLGRYSDGEFEILTGGGIYPPDSNWSQKWSRELERDLIAVLSSTDPRILIAVDPPSTFLSSRNTKHAIRFEYNMWVDMRRLMWKYLSSKVVYGHSHLFIKENCPDLDWDQLRDFLRQKDILVVTGRVHKIQHLTLGRSTSFIECGSEDAYERKEWIKQSIRDLVRIKGLDKKSTLVLASLGPTAEIIAYQLLDEEICVWDTGHIFEFAATNFLEKIFNN